MLVLQSYCACFDACYGCSCGIVACNACMPLAASAMCVATVMPPHECWLPMHAVLAFNCCCFLTDSLYSRQQHLVTIVPPSESPALCTIMAFRLCQLGSILHCHSSSCFTYSQSSLLLQVQGDTLLVANAGDSRCVVSEAGKAVPMSFDHKPTDEKEHSRIINVSCAFCFVRLGCCLKHYAGGG